MRNKTLSWWAVIQTCNNVEKKKLKRENSVNFWVRQIHDTKSPQIFYYYVIFACIMVYFIGSILSRNQITAPNADHAVFMTKGSCIGKFANIT